MDDRNVAHSRRSGCSHDRQQPFRVVRHLPGSEAMSRTAATVGQVLDNPRGRKPRRVPPWLENALNLWGFGRWSRVREWSEFKKRGRLPAKRLPCALMRAV